MKSRLSYITSMAVARLDPFHAIKWDQTLSRAKTTKVPSPN